MNCLVFEVTWEGWRKTVSFCKDVPWVCVWQCVEQTHLYFYKKHTSVYCLTFMQKLGYSIWEICLRLNSSVNRENQLLEVLCCCLCSNSLAMLWLIAMVLINLLFCGKYLNSSDSQAGKYREPLGLGAYWSSLCRLASKSMLLLAFFAGGLTVHGRN